MFGFDLVLLILLPSTITSVFINTTAHKWLGFVTTMAILIHLALHWAWINAARKRFLKQMANKI
jgi:cytochrome b561